ncbi:MAG: 50S ribosomal protein L17 [Bacteroidetes bacterium]|nr:50S ribosomal protein L17 [Bacteroidota bacterium]MBU1720767.1 50S ribosomal protein L17 [Bacteroidota bacterium]
MRHGKTNNHLGRTASHRKAMLANMAASLIMHKKISTTIAKAKELRKYVEPLITKSKDDSTHSRRVVFSYLQSKEAVTELFREVSKKIADRPGGYTRILKTGFRPGDAADLCIIELVDYNQNLLDAKDGKKGKASTRRSRRGASATAKKEKTGSKGELAEVNAKAKKAAIVDENVAPEVEAEAEVVAEPEVIAEPAVVAESEVVAEPEAVAEPEVKAETEEAQGDGSDAETAEEEKKEE